MFVILPFCAKFGCGNAALLMFGSWTPETLGPADEDDVIGPADGGKEVLQALVAKPGFAATGLAENPVGCCPQVFVAAEKFCAGV